ncbi:MAG TPA: exonuclease domain-containing protein [Candidatus Didemnitutus sp.]|nr:exonuclease domain-containing protein [Candidatus Didemnitutus sp.]
MLATLLENVRFVVIDVETTGGKAGDHRMTEIAMCVVEDDEIVVRYESLINPHQPIPDFIQMMTGITNEMVAGAPDEDVVLPPIVSELSSDEKVVVFVGHNVGFDWSFVSKAIERMGEPIPDVLRLCTCRLSRRLSVGLPKHNLGAVADFYGCSIAARHRAMGDTEATAKVLLKLIERARGEHDALTLGDLIALQHAPKSTTSSKSTSKVKQLLAPRLNELPDEPGVYYFLNTKKTVLYVGKAKSLRNRVNTYFHDGPLHGTSVRKMVRYIRHVEWETTGTELGAMLLESREIKTKHPLHNRAGLEYHPPAFLKITDEAFPRVELVQSIDDDGAEYFGPFRNRRMAERISEMVIREHNLRTCSGELFPDADVRPCFDYHIKKCFGPCALHQTIDDYRDSVERARRFLMNVESGAIAKLASQMEDAASTLDYERAAMLRDGIREIERVTLHGSDKPLAVTDTNVVIIVPTSDRYSTVEVYALRAGRLAYQRVIGTGADRRPLFEAIRTVFLSDAPQGAFNDRELDELRIITSWLYQRRERASTIVVRDVESIEVDLDHALGMYRKRSEPAANIVSEYSQIPDHDDYGV